MGKSARKKPRLPKSSPKSDPTPIILSTDDEADDDLSLKIVQKAMLRACGNEPGTNSGSEVKKKRKKLKEIEPQVNAGEETKEDVDAPVDAETAEPAEKSDNIILRKLLRGPRYFDPPDNNLGNCYNCGEAGHSAANCTSAKRKKPCFVCGSLEHNVKQCNKGKDCFICKKSGHRAKDCPEKSNFVPQRDKICLKCGDSGHEMWSCKGKYSPDDLKEIQCCVCKCFGHLCCVNYAGEGPKEASCYRCGQLGHSGWECARVHADTTNNGTPSSCYKCGQDGHVARKCTTSAKGKKKSGSPSVKKNHSKKSGNHLGVRSAPNTRKRNKPQYAEPSSSQPKPRGRGGWITEDPGDYNHNHQSQGWGSPKTPVRYKSNDRFHGSGYKSANDRYHHGGGGGGYNSGYNNNNNNNNSNNGRYHHYDSPGGSNGYQQQRYSASRFGNSSNYGKRDYSWDY